MADLARSAVRTGSAELPGSLTLSRTRRISSRPPFWMTRPAALSLWPESLQDVEGEGARLEVGGSRRGVSVGRAREVSDERARGVSEGPSRGVGLEAVHGHQGVQDLDADRRDVVEVVGDAGKARVAAFDGRVAVFLAQVVVVAASRGVEGDD